MAKLLSQLIIEQFYLTKGNTKKLQSHLCVYFNTTCITNKLCLGMMIKHTSWADPDDISTEAHSMEKLTVLVTLLLAKIETYIVLLQKKLLHISPSLLFSDLATWYINTRIKNSRRNRSQYWLLLTDINPSQTKTPWSPFSKCQSFKAIH